MPRTLTGMLKERIDEWRHGARLREDDQQPEQQENDGHRHHPVFLLLTQKLQELRKHATLAHDNLSTWFCSDRDCGTWPDRVPILASGPGGALKDPSTSAAKKPRAARTAPRRAPSR